MIKTILFDYDGVIVDSFSSVHNVYKIICNKLGKECPLDIEEFRKDYGLSQIQFMDSKNFSDNDKENADLIFGEEILKQNHTTYDGIKEVILNLSKKYKLVIVSSNFIVEIKKRLGNLGLIEAFSEIIGEEVGRNGKGIFQKAPAIKELLERDRVVGEEAIMIGDREVDYLEAKKAGVANVILVEYGWGYDKEKLFGYKQEVIVNCPEDILKAVETIDKT